MTLLLFLRNHRHGAVAPSVKGYLSISNAATSNSTAGDAARRGATAGDVPTFGATAGDA